MTLLSMTGFAREAGATGRHQWAWELRSVNGRGLDMRVRVPPGWEALGEEARQALQKTLTRGSIQVNLTLARAAAAPSVRINHAALAALVQALGRIDLPPGIAPATLDGLLAVRGIVEADENGEDPADGDDLQRDLKAAVPRAVAALAAARAGEGAQLADVVARQLSAMADLVDAAEACPARTPDAIRARLGAQVAALLESGQGLDPDRLHQEAVLIAARADIREELDRLRAHIESARALLQAGGAVGRRLDFLAQEFGREANTLCAKANDVALSRIGLDLKAVVEQFREQVQNVE